MPQLRNLTLTQLIRREVQVFLLVGTATVLIDLAAYKSLLFYFDFTVNLAKGCGFLSGTLFSYVANRIWTFQNKVFVPGSLYRFLPLYCSTLGINISVNFLILMAFSDIFLIDYIAFIAATGCSTVLNFLGMKFLFFESQILRGTNELFHNSLLQRGQKYLLLLERCLCLTQSDAAQIEIILVDNGSTDETPKVLDKMLGNFPGVRSVRVEVNKGYGFGILRV